MPEPRRGRVHDAEGAQEAILNAAEEVFAEHGFDGARMDAIAAKANYNKSLIFHYFGDKLGLYAEVLKRADMQLNVIQARLFSPMLEDATVTSDIYKFRALLKSVTFSLFDYLVENPLLMRILLWETAEGWQTYAKVAAQLQTDDIQQMDGILQKAHNAGLLRSDFSFLLQLTMILQLCQSYLAYQPLYQLLFPDEDFSSSAKLQAARENIAEFVVNGLTIHPLELQTRQDS